MADEKTFTQEDIDAAVEKAIGPLKEKLTEVMDEAKEAKRKLRAASEIKPEDLQAAEDRADKAEKDLADANKQVKALTKERDDATAALEGERGLATKMLTENALNDALAEVGVNVPGLLAGAKGIFGPQAQVVTEGDKRVVKIGDKTVTDAIKAWASTEDAKHFITAANNNGGGAPGSKGGTGGGKTKTEAEFNALPPRERATFMAEGGTIAA